MIKTILFCISLSRGEVCMNEQAFQEYVAANKHAEFSVKIVSK